MNQGDKNINNTYKDCFHTMGLIKCYFISYMHDNLMIFYIYDEIRLFKLAIFQNSSI